MFLLVSFGYRRVTFLVAGAMNDAKLLRQEQGAEQVQDFLFVLDFFSSEVSNPFCSYMFPWRCAVAKAYRLSV